MANSKVEIPKSKFQSRNSKVEIHQVREKDADYEINSVNYQNTVRFDRFIDGVFSDDASNDYYMTANNHGANVEAITPLFKDLGPFTTFLDENDAGGK